MTLFAEREESGAPRRPPQYPIESVDNALRLLLLLRDKQRLRLTDVSEHLGVASSTAHRLLAMLQYRGFVRQDPDSRAYEAGPALGDIAFAVLRRIDVRARARPVLERLNRELDETIHLGRLDGQLVNFLDSIESTRAVRVGARMGRMMPANCTSTGKAMLAMLSDDQVRALFPDEQLEGLTAHSIRTRTRLLKDLRDTRRHGYATSSEESEDGVISFAVAIRSRMEVSYAINTSLPTTRNTPPVSARIITTLLDARAEVDALLA